MKRRWRGPRSLLFFASVLALLLVACTAPTTVVQTVVVTAPSTPEVRVVTPTPSPTPPPVLQVCMGPEPGSLYLYSPGLNLVGRTILQALSMPTPTVTAPWPWRNCPLWTTAARAFNP